MDTDHSRETEQERASAPEQNGSGIETVVVIVLFLMGVVLFLYLIGWKMTLA